MRIDTWMRAGLLLAALLLVLAAAGCKVPRPEGGEAAAEAVVEDVAADETPAVNPDLVHFPMPDVLPGQDLVQGETEIMPEIRKPATGGVCPVAVTVDGDTTEVTILSMSVNCCTQRIRPSVEVRDGVAEVRIWEYMTDVCECFLQRSVRFRLAPFDPEGLEFRVFSNNRTAPCADGPALAGSELPD